MAIYMTLPCTASQIAYPHNRIRKLVTQLARPLDLTGTWEVGLSEIILPQVAIHLKKDAVLEYYEQDPAKYDKDNNLLQSVFTIPKGRYATVQEIVKIINAKSSHCKKGQSACWNLTVKGGSTTLIVQEGSWLWFKKRRTLYDFWTHYPETVLDGKTRL